MTTSRPPPLPVEVLQGPPGDQGLAHGRALRDQSVLTPAFVARYLGACAPLTRTEPGDLINQATRWIAELPPHIPDEIDGMARGARMPFDDVLAFLYADIAKPSRTPGAAPGDDARTLNPAATGDEHDLIARPRSTTPPPPGPMCSAVVHHDAHASPWIARNCDWLTATLARGTSAVVHRLPGRHPTLGVGIRGDIDVDTGLNAAGLWLHLHTLYAIDPIPADRPRISWLFWAREALETCATIDELEAFIDATARDRGVLVVAATPSKGAVFECGRATCTRHDAEPGRPLTATNHSPAKHIDDDRRSRARPGGSIARACRLRDALASHAPEHLPDDLAELLADPEIEMDRRPGSRLHAATGPSPISTIYSAVASPRDRAVWFAQGSADGAPAPSTGHWHQLNGLI
ncbi:MAG: C45 family peptidase [Planctomycetota bacterium]